MKNKGFFLIELLVGIAILSISIPIIYGGYFSLQKEFLLLKKQVQISEEYRFIDFVIRDTLKNWTTITLNKPNKIEGQSINGSKIGFIVKKGIIFRKVTNPGKRPASQSLNTILKINNIFLTKEINNLLIVTLSIKNTERKIKVWCKNLR